MIGMTVCHYECLVTYRTFGADSEAYVAFRSLGLKPIISRIRKPNVQEFRLSFGYCWIVFSSLKLRDV